MSIIRRAILVFALIAGITPAFAQAPPPVPTLPDTERRTSYSLSASTCACSVGFNLYGDSTDYGSWIEVFLVTGSGVSTVSTRLTAVTDYVITSATGSLGTIPRPITDGVLTLTTAKTGTLQIVGARRPRRSVVFAENRGVAARDLNQGINDITATLRELWDKTNDITGRGLFGIPGESILPMPPAAARAGGFLCWDATGLIPLACAPGTSTGNVSGPNSSINGHIALFVGTSGRVLQDGGTPGTGTVTGPVSSTNGAFAKWNGTGGLVLQDGPTIIPLASGGTNNSLTASNGGISYSDASGIQILSGTATARQMLQSGSSAAPAWSTATWPATTTANQLLYSSASNTVAGLATAASGTLVTDASSIPSISQTLPAAVQGNITTLGTIGTGVWNGTTIAVANGGTGGTSASGALLDNITGFASTGYVKRTGAGTYTFNSPIPLSDGGTNANLTASNGGLIYSTGSAAAILNGTGTANQIPLSGANSAPAWSTTTWPSTVTTNNILYASGSNAISGLATGNNGVLATNGSGIPAITSTLPTAVQSNITQLGTIGAGVWNGTAITGSFIGTNTVANSNLTQAIGPTLKGNPTASTANLQDFTIQGLANKPTPNANNDLVLLYDATSGSFKSVTPGQLASGGTAGVSSLNGLTGGLSIVAGDNVSVAASGSAVTISSLTTSGRLSFVSTTAIKFVPYNGDTIKINGSIFQIPSGGIAGVANTSVFVNGVAAQNLSASTLYYVYAFSNSGAVTADFSTTTHAVSSTAGNVGTEIKSGDDTRSLIGLVFTNASSQFVDMQTVSWFNRRSKSASVAVTANTSVSTSSFSEFSSSFRNTFVTWSDETVTALAPGGLFNTAAGDSSNIAIGFDGTTAQDQGSMVCNGTTAVVAGTAAGITTLSEGNHFATLLGRNTNSVAVTVTGGATSGARTALTVTIRG